MVHWNLQSPNIWDDSDHTVDRPEINSVPVDMTTSELSTSIFQTAVSHLDLIMSPNGNIPGTKKKLLESSGMIKMPVTQDKMVDPFRLDPKSLHVGEERIPLSCIHKY